MGTGATWLSPNLNETTALLDGGALAALLMTFQRSFLEGAEKGRSVWAEHPKRSVHGIALSLPIASPKLRLGFFYS
jgi:hypothetical protein